MDRYTFETLHWLELRFDPQAHAARGDPYVPYQPVHGIATWGPDEYLMAARLCRLLGVLGEIPFESFLDVGGAEGFNAWVVREVFGKPAVSVDLSVQAGQRAHEFFALPSAGVDSARLPFTDDAFDVVYLSEVLEHLAHPVRALLELSRIARRAVVVTTEAFARDEAERDEELRERRLSPHMDRSIFCPHDFELVFGDHARLVMNQCGRIPAPLPEAAGAIGETLKEVLCEPDLAWPAHGIVVVATTGEEVAFPFARVEALVERILGLLAPKERVRGPLEDAVPDELARRLVCPVTRLPLRQVDDVLVTEDGAHRYAVHGGVPALHTPLGEDFPRTLRDELAQRFGADDPRTEALLELDARLRFELPASLTGDDLAAAPIEQWELDGGRLALEDGQLEITAERSDPQLRSPRVVRPFADFGGVSFEIALSDTPRSEEEVQLFWWTLKRPLWYEAASVRATVPTDGRFHKVTLRVPGDTPAILGDELLRLRLDPCHDPARVRVRGLRIVGAVE